VKQLVSGHSRGRSPSRVDDESWLSVANSLPMDPTLYPTPLTQCHIPEDLNVDKCNLERASFKLNKVIFYFV
jgi:hypothetical protein